MALDPTAEAALALHRFGLGPRPATIANIASDPRAALLADLERPNAGMISSIDLVTSAASARAGFEAQAERNAKTVLEQRATKEAEKVRLASGAPMMAMTTKSEEIDADPDKNPTIERQIFLKEVRARLDAALTAEVGFVERLVWFWSNHFCVSSFVVPTFVGGYEREAIRPHVLGRFVDMLLTAEGHPAMLYYLNNAASMGPNSIAGINRSRGLNENLARETLELHTLGVRTGYTQDDVISFAKVLTGWTVLPITDNPEHGGEFVFNKRLHEPGPQQVLARTYADDGVEQGRAVLKDLAREPATALHIATKLARHFSVDLPPPSLVERLAKVFRDTDGDLKEMAKALVLAPETWAQPRTKLKRPSEWGISMVRATGLNADPARYVGGLALLGEPLWRPSAPKGFPDEEADWIDGIGSRLDIANNFAERAAERIDAQTVVEGALGSLASAETRAAIARAENRQQALALVFMAPEFLRR